MSKGIEKDMYDRLLVLQERTIIALEKMNNELTRLNDHTEKIEDMTASLRSADDKAYMWMKVLAGMVALLIAIVTLINAYGVKP